MRSHAVARKKIFSDLKAGRVEGAARTWADWKNDMHKPITASEGWERCLWAPGDKAVEGCAWLWGVGMRWHKPDHGAALLNAALLKGNLPLVEWLSAHGAPLQTKPPRTAPDLKSIPYALGSMTPLEAALSGAHPEAVRWVLDRQPLPEPTSSRWYPLWDAATYPLDAFQTTTTAFLPQETSTAPRLDALALLLERDIMRGVSELAYPVHTNDDTPEDRLLATVPATHFAALAPGSHGVPALFAQVWQDYVDAGMRIDVLMPRGTTPWEEVVASPLGHAIIAQRDSRALQRDVCPEPVRASRPRL